jgi:metallophosphoesterase superfamily enzyme
MRRGNGALFQSHYSIKPRDNGGCRLITGHEKPSAAIRQREGRQFCEILSTSWHLQLMAHGTRNPHQSLALEGQHPLLGYSS